MMKLYNCDEIYDNDKCHKDNTWHTSTQGRNATTIVIQQLFQ